MTRGPRSPSSWRRSAAKLTVADVDRHRAAQQPRDAQRGQRRASVDLYAGEATSIRTSRRRDGEHPHVLHDGPGGGAIAGRPTLTLTHGADSWAPGTIDVARSRPANLAQLDSRERDPGSGRIRSSRTTRRRPRSTGHSRAGAASRGTASAWRRSLMCCGRRWSRRVDRDAQGSQVARGALAVTMVSREHGVRDPRVRDGFSFLWRSRSPADRLAIQTIRSWRKRVPRRPSRRRRSADRGMPALAFSTRQRLKHFRLRGNSYSVTLACVPGSPDSRTATTWPRPTSIRPRSQKSPTTRIQGFTSCTRFARADR